MKAIPIFLKKIAAPLVLVCCLFACDLDDAPPLDNTPPSNVLTNYDLPAEMVEEIFTDDVLEITGSLEPFFDKIRQHGMIIHDGDSIPSIGYLDYRTKKVAGRKYQIANDCIYDSLFPSYKDSIFGKYEDSLLITNFERQTFESYVSYSSVFNRTYEMYPEGFDTGEAKGFVSGNEGKNFTIFIKVENGKFGTIPYKSIWMISGTYQLIDGEKEIPLNTVTKCMIMLSKGNDFKNELANEGTIRIFKDDNPIPVE